MSADPKGSVVFMPWVRQGAAAAINVADTLGSNMRGAVDLKATLAINSVPGDPITVRLRGPADVLGIDPNEIVRVDPKPNTTDFEPNYFPGIEFDRPDFPWLFTPAKPGENAKLRPWLCLVVVRQQEGVLLSSSADAPLPILNINGPAKPADELPDLVDSWAWVHAQVAASSLAQTNPATLKDDIRTQPERSLSRLLCPRILQPNTDYVACVVPTFELGRRAGLGEEIKDTDLTATTALKPAWSLTPTAPTSVRLPVYYQWRFRTGEGGDFESLVRLLRAVPAPDNLGKRPMDISEPGFGLPATFPHDAQLSLEGALRPLEKRDFAPWPDDAQEPFQTELAEIINAPGEALIIDPESDPLLAPPLYGQWHAARSTVTRGAPPWFDELNLDPRHRSVAAFGTRVVQEHQEALMASAWEQAGDLQRANQRMRQLQLSLAAGTSLYARHFKNLSDDAMLRVSAPALARLRAVGAMGDTGTLAGAIASKALPIQAASTAMRRIARERGPITRRIAAQGLVRSASPNWMMALNTDFAFTFVTPTLPDMATFGVVRQRIAQPTVLSQFREVTAETVAAQPAKPHFRIAPEGQSVFHALRYQPVPPQDNPTSQNFRAAAQAHLARVAPGRLSIIFAQPALLAMQDLRAALETQMEPRRTLVPLAQAVFAMSPTATATPPTNTGIVPIEPIMTAPKFPQPMYESLRDLSQQLLLPGLETVEPNSVLGLETNSRFVEAYMVGLNFEMGRELLWRGYPTDQRGTYFDRFWDSRSSGGGADVNPIHGWKDRPLGDPQTAPAGDRFVMLIRSSLLRRYPSAVIYAAKAIKPNAVRKPTKSPDEEEHPVFRGSMQPDVTFFGFDLTVGQVVGSGTDNDLGYFIVIQEQPGEPRFGYDVGTPLNEGTHLQVSFGAPAGSTTGPTFHWGQNGAHIAAMLRQQPVRIAIHASQFLKKKS
ncbi:MAG TPA: hypothetical protein VGQ22_18680 [Steroidobacteraceae bacterium]|jgi:hypothetical protein|nr:hypothetical protein [Steroidobacteraceae bacterium]